MSPAGPEAGFCNRWNIFLENNFPSGTEAGFCNRWNIFGGKTLPRRDRRQVPAGKVRFFPRPLQPFFSYTFY